VEAARNVQVMRHYAWNLPYVTTEENADLIEELICSRFGDGGYRDLLVQSEVIAEGSVDRVLTGKMYNRSVRAVKLTFEALNRILIDMFEQELDAKLESTEMLASVREEISTFTTDINNESFESLTVNQHFQTYRSKFDEFLENMKTNNGDLAHYWMSFLEMAQILLNVIFATRSGNWVLLLESLKDIVPYTFAYDNINYARYVILKYCVILKYNVVLHECPICNISHRVKESDFSGL